MERLLSHAALFEHRLVDRGAVPDQVWNLLMTLGRRRGCVAGGAARAALAPGSPPPGDIDVFLYHGEDFAQARSDIEALGYQEDGDGWNLSGTALTLHPVDSTVGPLAVQLVQDGERGGTWGTVEDVLGQFGFTAEQFALVRKRDGVYGVSSARSREDNAARRLMFVSNPDPVRSAYRLAKNAAKGYKVNASHYARLFQQFSDADAAAQVEFVQNNSAYIPT